MNRNHNIQQIKKFLSLDKKEKFEVEQREQKKIEKDFKLH